VGFFLRHSVHVVLVLITACKTMPYCNFLQNLMQIVQGSAEIQLLVLVENGSRSLS